MPAVRAAVRNSYPTSAQSQPISGGREALAQAAPDSSGGVPAIVVVIDDI